jgi:hypothetical protein
VRTGCGDFQRTLHLLLAFYVAEVGVRRTRRSRSGLVFGQRRLPGDVSHDLEQGARREDARPLGERRLGRIGLGQDESASRRAGRERHGQRAAHRAQFAGQRELAGELERSQRLRRELAA